MNSVAKLLAFAALLGLTFGGAALAGAAIDPTDAGETSDPGAGHGGSGDGHDADGSAAGAEAGLSGRQGASMPAVRGLAVSAGGFTLSPDRTLFTLGGPERFSFRIIDAEGGTVRDGYEPIHERELHLIVVSRDTATFQHLHPDRSPDGTWSTELELPRAGTYRVFADFMVDGQNRTLASDVFVPGEFQPERLPDPVATDQAGGYTAELASATAPPGTEQELAFAVTRNGQPARDLEDYLGAGGHLVALREGDLAYLHVHPLEGEAHGDGDSETAANANEIAFAATFPTAGRYRLFLQFKAASQIRTVDYTLEVPR